MTPGSRRTVCSEITITYIRAQAKRQASAHIRFSVVYQKEVSNFPVFSHTPETDAESEQVGNDFRFCRLTT